MKSKGVSARGWFYGQSFHSIPNEAEADGAIAAAFLEHAGVPIDDAPTDDCPECGADLNDIRAKGQTHIHGYR
jgi:hypothetical protein